MPGTYHTVESSPVGLFDSIKAIYNGMLNGADVIFFVFIAYAAIGLIISTGAFNGLVAGLLKVLKENLFCHYSDFHSGAGLCFFHYWRI